MDYVGLGNLRKNCIKYEKTAFRFKNGYGMIDVSKRKRWIFYE